MVESFGISKIPRIIFGPGNLGKLPEILKEFGDKILIITGASSFNSGPYGKKFSKSLNNLHYSIFRESIHNEPTPSDIDNIADKYRHKDIDAVVGIGGGSALDTAKAVSAMLKLNDSVRNYIEGVGTRVHPGIKVPFVAVPTTAGTGSEATENAVICEVGRNGFKKSLRQSNLMPDIALVDPELTLGCPPGITAASGMDALTQLLESFLSVKSNIFIDSLAVDSIRLIIEKLPRAFINGNDLEARSSIAYAAMISGITLANVGLGVVHGFASSVGAIIEIPHGVLCGTLLGTANRINVKKLVATNPDSLYLKKYARLGSMFHPDRSLDDLEYAMFFINILERLVEELQLPRIGKFGLDEKHIDKVINATSQKNNPVALDNNELKEILISRL